jgi:hypothetical protein
MTGRYRWPLRISEWIIVIVIPLLLYPWLLRQMADRQVVAALLSAGDHLPTGTVVIACLFLLLRLYVIVLLPAFILSRLGRLGFDWWWRRRPRVSEDGSN